MRITLLGTGSADGWPNPFCDCGSCAAERAAGRSRAPACALVDHAILIDCGPGALPHARDCLGPVEHVVVTHGHPDHLDPALLLWRRWAGTPTPLHVWGPAAAIDLCRPWLAPRDRVDLHVLAPADRVSLATRNGEYRLVALPAAHSSGNGDRVADEALIFSVRAPDGHALLYATDTGPLGPTRLAALAALAGESGPYDVVILDETFGDTIGHGAGHLGLDTLPAALDGLRRAGAITAGSRIVATHLSHHNPPTPVLRARLAGLGVEVPDDGAVIEPGAPTSRSLLVIGGARSGKSALAESVARSWGGAVTYVATGGDRPQDPEWSARIASHRARRPAGWTTIESLDAALAIDGAEPGGVVLVDCLTLWLAGHLDRMDAWTRLDSGQRAGIEADAQVLAERLCSSIASCRGDVIVVANEVGSGIVPTTAAGRLFQDLMGRLAAMVGGIVDDAVLVVAGRAVRLPAPGQHRAGR